MARALDGFDDDRPPDAHEQRVVVFVEEEVAGTEQPRRRVIPAQQGLDPDRLVGREVDDRLVQADQLTAVERPLELRLCDRRLA